jgi:hypothetical protein
MSGLVTFDPKGPWGPAAQLFFNSEEYTYSGLHKIATLLKQNLKNAGITAQGKKIFCVYANSRNGEKNPLTPVEILGTQFFQNMLKREKSIHHQKALEFIVPCLLQTVENKIPGSAQKVTPEIKEWYASIVTCIMTEQEIEKQCNVQAQADAEINQLRGDIGTELVQACEAGKITEEDLNAIIEVGRFALNRVSHADHVDSALYLAGRYITLAGKGGPIALNLGDTVFGLLATRFKQRYFPK